MKIVHIDYAANLPLYLTVEFCGQAHKIQLDVLQASKLKSFMRHAKQNFENNPPAPQSSKQDTIFLGVIPLGETKPIPYDEWLKRRQQEEKTTKA